MSSFTSSIQICNLTDIRGVAVKSVTNSSKVPVQFRVRFLPETRPLQRVFTKNPTFQVHNFNFN
jgi:hypothetical protein